eukprot:8977620-Pyramimonas_sp.AAC.1
MVAWRARLRTSASRGQSLNKPCGCGTLCTQKSVPVVSSFDTACAIVNIAAIAEHDSTRAISYARSPKRTRQFLFAKVPSCQPKQLRARTTKRRQIFSPPFCDWFPLW